MSPTSLSQHALVVVSLIASRAMTISTSVVRDEHAAKKASTFAVLLSDVEEVASTYAVWRAVPRMLPLRSVTDTKQGESTGFVKLATISKPF
jgi:hypothetical protein